MRAIKVRCGKVMERFGFLLLPAGHILLLGPIAAWIIRGGRGMDLLWGAAVLCLMVLADGCLFRLLIYQRKKERLLEQILDYQHMEQLNRTRELVARERRREADALRIQLKDELKQVRELIHKFGKEAESDRESVSGRVGEMLDGFLRTARQKDGAEFCGNALVSTVLEEKLRACETFQIRLEAKVYVPAGIAIRNYYLCSVFSNLLDNAIDACRALPSAAKERTISVMADVRGDYLFVRVTNPARREYAERPDKMGHGMGREIVGRIARACQGEYWTAMEDGVYTAAVVLQIGTEE